MIDIFIILFSIFGIIIYLRVFYVRLFKFKNYKYGNYLTVKRSGKDQ